MSLTENQIRGFERNGVICVRNVLLACEIEALRIAVECQIASLGKSLSGYDLESIADQVWRNVPTVDVYGANRFDLEEVKRRVLAYKNAHPLRETGRARDTGMFFYDAAGWKQYQSIRDVAFESKLPKLIATLLRSKRLNFWEDTTFVKRPGTRQKTVFHQDKGYFQISGLQCAIVWIPLDPTSLENGTLQYVRGSHLNGQIYAPSVFFARCPREGAQGNLVPDIDAKPDAYDLISFDTQPGDVIVHHVNTVHGAGGNMSTRDRRAMSFRYCGDDILYAERPAAIKQLNVSQSQLPGKRLNSTDYPIVWPKMTGAVAHQEFN